MSVYEVVVSFTISTADEAEARELIVEALTDSRSAEWRSWDIQEVRDTGDDA